MKKFQSLSAPNLTSRELESAKERLEAIYQRVAEQWPGFLERPGQVQMIQSCAEVLLSAKAATDATRDGSNLGAFEAGTGTGKTVAYCLAGIIASEALGKPVIISTATVPLQEQLFFRDLPRLAELIPELKFELMKGRGRYVCRARLEQALSGETQPDLALSDEAGGGEVEGNEGDAPSSQAIQWFAGLHRKLHRGIWNGEVDSLEDVPSATQWSLIQADAHACNNQQCEHYAACEFHNARSRCKDATLIVANHALLMSSLANEAQLLNVDDSLVVIDEAHHLPDIAVDQLADRVRLSQSRQLLAGFKLALKRANATLPATQRADISEDLRNLHMASEQLSSFEDWVFESNLVSPEAPTFRFPNGLIPQALAEQCQHLAKLLVRPLTAATHLRGCLNHQDESLSPKERARQLLHANELGRAAHRTNTIVRVFTSWSEHEQVPKAKWIELAEEGHSADAWFSASPLSGSSILARLLWRRAGAAVCTSATLTACDSFDFFDRLSGYRLFPKRRSGIMQSPFDYQTQGQLRLSPLKESPKSKDFSAALCARLPQLLGAHTNGQLMLFTSKRQMETCYKALPADIRRKVLMQGNLSRRALLSTHAERVAQGASSILFGLQSLGEGLDLPGPLCEHVIIDKLPFTPPSSPVEEALQEWLEAQGRDAFYELAVPRAAMHLAQWIGRGVRTVTDYATITVCDNRLGTTGYGRRILEGLPDFPVVPSAL